MTSLHGAYICQGQDPLHKLSCVQGKLSVELKFRFAISHMLVCSFGAGGRHVSAVDPS